MGLSEGGHSSTFPRKENLDFTGEEQPTGLCRRQLEIVRVIDTPEATHIRYRVRR